MVQSLNPCYFCSIYVLIVLDNYKLERICYASVLPVSTQTVFEGDP